MTPETAVGSVALPPMSCVFRWQTRVSASSAFWRVKPPQRLSASHAEQHASSVAPLMSLYPILPKCVWFMMVAVHAYGEEAEARCAAAALPATSETSASIARPQPWVSARPPCRLRRALGSSQHWHQVLLARVRSRFEVAVACR